MSNELEMTIEDAIDIFNHYSFSEKNNFLIELAYALTILARETYEVGGAGLSRPARLRSINEIQHRLTSFLMALRAQDSGRYPDEVLVRIILEHPQDPELQQQVYQVVTRLLSRSSLAA
jgi:hypothetical protein